MVFLCYKLNSPSIVRSFKTDIFKVLIVVEAPYGINVHKCSIWTCICESGWQCIEKMHIVAIKRIEIQSSVVLTYKVILTKYDITLYH